MDDATHTFFGGGNVRGHFSSPPYMVIFSLILYEKYNLGGKKREKKIQ